MPKRFASFVASLALTCGAGTLVASPAQAVVAPTKLAVGQILTASASEPVPVPATWQKRVLKLTNKKRARHGLKPVRYSKCAKKYARRWAKKMAAEDFFEHQDLSGLLSCPKVWVAGENIAMGYSKPGEVVRAWMKSPGHRAIILDKRFTQLSSVGVQAPNGDVYWVQNFVGK